MRIALDDIIVAVCRYYRLEKADLLGPDQHHLIAHPRQVAFSLARDFTEAAPNSIARRFNRDRTTVLHGLKNHSHRCRTMEDTARDYAYLSRKLGAYKERMNFDDAYDQAWRTWAFVHRSELMAAE